MPMFKHMSVKQSNFAIAPHQLQIDLRLSDGDVIGINAPKSNLAACLESISAFNFLAKIVQHRFYAANSTELGFMHMSTPTPRTSQHRHAASRY